MANVTVTATDSSGRSTQRSLTVAVARPVQPPTSIDRTGTADISAALTAWLAALPAGATADLGWFPYRSETLIKPALAHDVTLRHLSLTRTLNATDAPHIYPNPNPHLWLLNVVNPTIDGYKVRGRNIVSDVAGHPEFGAYTDTYAFDAMLRLEKCTKAIMSGWDGDGIWGDGIQMELGSGHRVGVGKVDRVGRQGIAVLASDVKIDGFSVLHGRRSGCDLEPNTSSQVFSDIEIANCYLNTHLLPIAGGGKGQVNNVWIHDNTSDGASVPAIHCVPSDTSIRHDWKIERHSTVKSLGSPQYVVRMTGVRNVTVTDSTFLVSAAQSKGCVDLTNCGGLVVVRRNKWGAGQYLRNTTPQADLTFDVGDNTPALVMI